MKQIINQFFTYVKRKYLIITAVLVVLLFLSLISLGFLKLPILSEGELNTWKLIVQVLGGGLLLYGLHLNNKRIIVNENQVKVTEDGNVTERFKNAIEHLGSKSDTIRLGGIYALYRIAKDSEKDRESIQNILCSYVRKFNRKEDGLIELQSLIDLLTDSTVFNSNNIDFSLANLKRIDFANRNLSGATLQHANFTESVLLSTNLSSANLLNANFTGATLAMANLENALTLGANFSYANLYRAKELEFELLRTADSLYRIQLSDESLLKKLKEEHPELFVKPEEE